jgi:hypothetical protein
VGEHVLERERDAGQRAQPLPRTDASVDRGGRGQCPLAVDVQKGVHLGVDGTDPVQVSLGDLDR